MTDHSPGPWNFRSLIDKDPHCVGYVEDAKGNDVTSVGEMYLPEAESLANAYLISAAPDLLEACELLLEQYEAQDGYKMGGALTNEPFLKIRKAVRKAKNLK